jgi:type I restriction enzyme S subunit
VAGIDAAVGANLPVSWALAPLGEITRPERPRVRPADFPQLPFIGMEHVEAHTMRLLGTVPAGTMKSQAVHFFPGDVLYGRLRPYLNKVFRPDFEGLCSAEFIVFPATDDLNGKYLQYFLNSSGFVSFAAHLDEGDRPRVDFTQLSGYLMPIVPPPEQRRIVAEIEKQFTRLDAATAALKRVKAKLKMYRVSVLKAACEGRLVPTEAEVARAEGRSYETGEHLLKRILRERRARWETSQLENMNRKGRRKDDRWKSKYHQPRGLEFSARKPLPEGWVWCSVGEAFEVWVGATPSRARPDYWNGDINWVSSGEVAFCRIRNTRERITEAGLRNSSTVVHPAGTVLLGMIGQGKTRGQVAILEIEAANNQNSAAIRASQAGLPAEFVYRFFEAQYDNVRRISRGNNQLALNKIRVEAIPLPLPPVAEQYRIVAESERQLSVVDELETLVDTNIKRAARLRQAILKRAFEGKLVPEDPNDEAASVLLERIRASRSAAIPVKPPRLLRKKRAAVVVEKSP